MFAIVDASAGIAVEAEAVGGISWWLITWHDEDVYEAGWSVVPASQTRGVAKAAVALVIADVRVHGKRRLLTALPSVHNVPSNRLCAGAGFQNRGVESFPFRGTTLTVNAWVLDLSP